MPARFLEPVLQELVRSGVLTSVRGPRGGYKLARERRRISLGDIYRAAGATTPAEDPDDDIPPSPITAKVVQPLWDKLAAELQQQLDAVTLDDLCREARAKGIGNLGGDCLDFTI
jgi:Rrf2 family protein